MQQATCAHSGADTSTSPGNSSTFSAPSRRKFLAALAIGPAASALSAVNAAAADTRPWDRKLAEYRAARGAADDFNESVYQPAWARLNKLAGKEPTLSFTHTARSGHVATFRMTRANIDDYARNLAYGPLARPVRDAWLVWEKRQERAERVVGWAAIVDRQDALDAVEYRTQAALIAEPAPDCEAVAIKLKVALERVSGELMDDDRNALLADLARLAP